MRRSGASGGAPAPPLVCGYELLGPLGEGGMAQVFRAREPESGECIALKLIQPARAGDEDFQARWGAIYDGMLSTQRSSLVYNVIFIVRRVILAAIVFISVMCV